jgi:hypothetical protein
MWFHPKVSDEYVHTYDNSALKCQTCKIILDCFLVTYCANFPTETVAQNRLRQINCLVRVGQVTRDAVATRENEAKQNCTSFGVLGSHPKIACRVCPVQNIFPILQKARIYDTLSVVRSCNWFFCRINQVWRKAAKLKWKCRGGGGVKFVY